MRVLRLIKGVTRRDRLWNEDIRAELQVSSILQFIEDTQMRWYGHMRRMTPSSQQSCTTLVETEAKDHQTQWQTEETMDGEHQGSRRIERIHTEGDRAISSVPGQRRVEKLCHWQARPTRSAVQLQGYCITAACTAQALRDVRVPIDSYFTVILGCH